MKQIVFFFFCVLCIKTTVAQQKNSRTNAYEYLIELKGVEGKAPFQQLSQLCSAKTQVLHIEKLGSFKEFILRTKVPVTKLEFLQWLNGTNFRLMNYNNGVYSADFLLKKKIAQHHKSNPATERKG